jgi:hypothetical protein
MVIAAPSSVPPGGSIGAGGIILDVRGKPVLGADGQPMRIAVPSSVPPGGSIGAGGIILDAGGKPLLGADGKPMVIAAPSSVPPGGSIGAGGIILDASGKPVLGADGKPKRVMDPRVPPGGSIGAGGVILDQKGKPVLGADGQPMRIDTSAGKYRVLSGDECPSLPWLVIVTSPGRRRALGSDDPPSPRDTSRPSLGYQSQTVRSILDVTGKIHDATGGTRPREVLPQSTGKTFPRVPLAQSTALPLRSRMGVRRSPMEPPPVGKVSAPSSGLPCVSRTCPPGGKFPTGTRGPMAAFSGMPRRPTPLPAKGQGMHSMMRNSVSLPVLAAYASSHGGLHSGTPTPTACHGGAAPREFEHCQRLEQRTCGVRR